MMGNGKRPVMQERYQNVEMQDRHIYLEYIYLYTPPLVEDFPSRQDPFGFFLRVTFSERRRFGVTPVCWSGFFGWLADGSSVQSLLALVRLSPSVHWRSFASWTAQLNRAAIVAWGWTKGWAIWKHWCNGPNIFPEIDAPIWFLSISLIIRKNTMCGCQCSNRHNGRLDMWTVFSLGICNNFLEHTWWWSTVLFTHWILGRPNRLVRTSRGLNIDVLRRGVVVLPFQIFSVRRFSDFQNWWPGDERFVVGGLTLVGLAFEHEARLERFWGVWRCCRWWWRCGMAVVYIVSSVCGGNVGFRFRYTIRFGPELLLHVRIFDIEFVHWWSAFGLSNSTIVRYVLRAILRGISRLVRYAI